MMDGSASVNKSPTLTWFFFPGGGKWKSMTIEAATREEAEEIYRTKQEPVDEQVEETGSEAKAEETETNNE